MATTSAPSAGSMLSTVGSLQNSIAAARDRALAQSGTTADTAKAQEVKEYRKDVRKSPYTNAGAATDIGILVKDKSRLNVISSLPAKDNVDFYKFKVVNRGEMALGNAGEEGVRVQVMSKLGSVIADSDENAGSSHEAYKKMKEGSFEIGPGDYVLRVTRDAKADPKKGLNYALQVRMGNYREDYDTVAKPPAAGDGVPKQSVGMQNLQSMLNTATANISSLPPIGTSATSKLMGVMGSGASVFGTRALSSIKGATVNIKA